MSSSARQGGRPKAHQTGNSLPGKKVAKHAINLSGSEFNSNPHFLTSQDPRLFFELLWRELFGDEEYHVENMQEYVKDDSLDWPNNYMRIRRGKAPRWPTEGDAER